MVARTQKELRESRKEFLIENGFKSLRSNEAKKAWIEALKDYQRFLNEEQDSFYEKEWNTVEKELNRI